eukprot:13911462-Ditylum_brightwellii.AAC.1
MMFLLSICAGNLSPDTSGLSISSFNIRVEWIFWRTLVCCPLTVAPDFWRCLLTNFSVSPGHVEKKPRLIAAIHDFGAGQNAVA